MIILANNVMLVEIVAQSALSAVKYVINVTLARVAMAAVNLVKDVTHVIVVILVKVKILGAWDATLAVSLVKDDTCVMRMNGME